MFVENHGRSRAWLAAWALLAITLALTLSRALRWPNDFSEAHWLLDYRFGFVKRGLAGQMLSTALGLAGAEPTAAIISAIAVVLLSALALTLLWMAWQLARRAAHPGAAVLAGVAFLSSPFVVMSAHLIGYLDGILILLAVAAVALMVRGRVWAAGAVQAAAVLVHESAVVVGFPVLCFAWWVTRDQARGQGSVFRRAAPLALPLAAFAALALSAQSLPADFEDRYSQHLMRYAFVEGDMHIFVPEWLTPGFAQHAAEQKHRFAERLSGAATFGLILPTVFALLAWTIDACRVRPRSITLVLLVAATFAPQVMHIAAWDTVRIWTYSIVAAWLCAWTLARAIGAGGLISPAVRAIAVLAVLANVMVATPLLDNLADRYALTTRVLLFGPVLAAALRLLAGRTRPDLQ